MTREHIKQQVLNCTKRHILLECATGVGKTKLALDKTVQWFNPNSNILIVIPRNVLIKGWLDEIHKWGYDDITNNITFSTYVSIPKQDTTWDIVIFDECHHLSRRCIDTIKYWKIKNTILLSATIKRDLKYIIQSIFRGVECIKINTQDAIDNNILPDPRVYVLPIRLDNTRSSFIITKNKAKASNCVLINYADRWKYKSYKAPYGIRCTQQQYYDDMSSLIEWYKRRAMSGNQIFKNQWLHKCNERLKWLAGCKIDIVSEILYYLRDKRTLTFCADIKQSEALEEPCVNSKIGTKNLEDFNAGNINHITAVGMLDEGANLTNCQVGIFNMLNSSDRLVTQRIGRILRHPNPVIIIPYFRNTRDEEILNKMLEGYDKSLITVIHNIQDIKL